MKKRMLESLFLIKKPVHLILHVTNKCNLRCKTCFVNFDKFQEEELTLKEIKGISAYLNKLIWLDIGGGEPFLKDDLPDICAAFDVKSITIPTNGFNPTLIYETTKKIRNKTTAEINIAVSLDGFENTNNEIRGMGCFNNSIEVIRLLKTIKGIRIRVITVLCERNYDELIDFMKFIKSFNLDFHSINFRRGPKNAFPLYDRPSYERLLKIKKDIFEIWDSYDYGFGSIAAKILKNYQRIMYETSLRIIKEKKQIPGCLAGRRHLVVYSNGNVAFCEMLAPFGNIRSTKIETMLNSAEANIQRNFIKEKKCHCYHNCNFMENFFLNPLQYPKLLNDIWKR